MKVFLVKMHAGMMGTDNAEFQTAEKKEDLYLWDQAVEWAESYGVYEEEPGVFKDGDGNEYDPECWVSKEIKTVKELEESSCEVLCGSETLEDITVQLKASGATLCNTN